MISRNRLTTGRNALAKLRNRFGVFFAERDITAVPISVVQGRYLLGDLNGLAAGGHARGGRPNFQNGRPNQRSALR
jgi:hypothetical protein